MIKKCLYCEKEFEDRSYTQTALYCSSSCGKKYRRRNEHPINPRNCPCCGKLFTPSNRRQKHCSAKCKKWVWRHVVSPEKEKNSRKKQYYKRKLSEELHNRDKELARKYSKLPSRKYNQIRVSADVRGYDFDITLDYYIENFIDKKCYYCHGDTTGGIDRKDNSIGYIKENCVPCCKRCNIAKNIYTVDDFISHCITIAEIHSRNTSSINNTAGVRSADSSAS